LAAYNRDMSSRKSTRRSVSTGGYREYRTINGRIARQVCPFVSRPGLSDWDTVPVAMELHARHVRWERHERVLLLNCGHGALGVWLGQRHPQVSLSLADTHHVAAQAARANLDRMPHGTNVTVGLPADEGAYNAVVLLAPKGRALARLLILAGRQVLAKDGMLYVAGPKAAGIKSVLADAEQLLGPPLRGEYGGGGRWAAFSRGADGPLTGAYAVDGVRPGTYHHWKVEIGGDVHHVATRPGVFSWRELDTASRLLLESLQLDHPARLADVGCGYGIIGLYLARRHPSCEVTMVDVDTLACDCARQTLALNRVSTAQVHLGDGLQGLGQNYDAIVSNPPFHTGHNVNLQMTHQLIVEAHAACALGGHLALVANRFLPYDRAMRQRFGNVTTLAETSRFRVLQSTRR